MRYVAQALGHYEQFLALSERAADIEAQGSACFALAQVYQRMQVRPLFLNVLRFCACAAFDDALPSMS